MKSTIINRPRLFETGKLCPSFSSKGMPKGPIRKRKLFITIKADSSKMDAAFTKALVVLERMARRARRKAWRKRAVVFTVLMIIVALWTI